MPSITRAARRGAPGRQVERQLGANKREFAQPVRVAATAAKRAAKASVYHTRQIRSVREEERVRDDFNELHKLFIAPSVID